MWTLDEVLTTAARKYGAREALVTANRRVTFSELDAAVTRMAAHLQSHGVGPGDKVAVLGRNTVSWVVGFLATLRLGGTTVPLKVRAGLTRGPRASAACHSSEPWSVQKSTARRARGRR